MDNGCTQFVVDIRCRTYTCRKWDLTRILCAHAIKAIVYNNETPEEYVDDSYKVTTYMRIYNHILKPIDGPERWPNSTLPPVLPPPQSKVVKGQKQTVRRKEAEEKENATKKNNQATNVLVRLSKKVVKMTCSICRETGHNKRHHAHDHSQTQPPP